MSSFLLDCLGATCLGSKMDIMALRRVGAAGKGKQKELTEEQKQEIKEAFDLFDTDGSVFYYFSSEF